MSSKYGFNVNYDALAKGFIDLLDQGELSVLAFGMIPHDKFKLFMNEMWKQVAEKSVAGGAKYEGMEASDMVGAIKPDFKREVEHEFSLAIYRNAKMVV